jgi:hypothetical protein
MAIDLTGISNENEFYTHHYLSAILENDLKELFARWSALEEEQDARAPYKELAGLARDFFQARQQMQRARSPEERLRLHRGIAEPLLAALGYPFAPALKPLDSGALLPVLGEVTRPNGAPLLWVLEAPVPEDDEDTDPLDLHLVREQFRANGTDASATADGAMPLDEPIAEVVTRQVFTLQEVQSPPRWVLVVGFDQVVLLDRNKWNQKRLLRFDLEEIFGRKEPSTLRAMAALLHRDSTCPAEGFALLDTLDENSHKHAFSVSEDLKYALRESIEILGNEAVHYLRNVAKQAVFNDRLKEGELTEECLRYMYRMLFLFYIEARPELGYAPLKSDEYRTGYSLESLRDLEMVPLTTESSKNGFYLHESIQKLFELVFQGFGTEEDLETQQMALDALPDHHTFRMAPLKSHLFDPARTPMLNRVRFRNEKLQRVLELMSLSRPKGARDRRGRISYAQLGINQLGAVYESLLSFRGFFAETDLYEVKKAGENPTELDNAYFVRAEDLAKYTDEEKVYNGDGTLRKFPKGTFIYRLAGRSREKSASYYTPEVLTQCLVKYALKELIGETGAESAMPADEILELTVCEPAMGSGAFLNEAINQLAEAYLQRKQQETGVTISHDRYAFDKQRVKMFIADRNVYGVDLNPVAVELAEVSLWLNTISEQAFVPWFGMQLVCGNSLIGARRQVFDASLLGKRGKTEPTWLDSVPERVMPGTARPANGVYHFLVPDLGMADYDDKVIKDLAGEQIRAIKEWRKEFTKPFSAADIATLKRLSGAVDRLWARHTEQQRRIRERTTDDLEVFGRELKGSRRTPTTTQQKDKIFEQELLSQNVRNSSAYRRLKLVMDYWCALWFWPIEQADLLPTRDEFLLEMALILEGSVSLPTSAAVQAGLFPQESATYAQAELVDELGYVDVDRVSAELSRLGMVMRLSDRYRFLHWEVEFADLFSDRRGFDLVVGNPPWIKIEWNESGVLGDFEPLFVVRSLRASELSRMRNGTMARHGIGGLYFSEYAEAAASQSYLNSNQNYSLLRGSQANLYKCFLPQSWMVLRENAVSAFLHPEGVFDDSKGGALREEISQKLVYHFQFQNELKLFKDIGNREKFSVNVYSRSGSSSPQMICNLFHPTTIDQCFDHDGSGICGGIKDDENKWNLAGHSDRIVSVRRAKVTYSCRSKS